jgi:fibronectin-binding autotransporter adhesin
MPTRPLLLAALLFCAAAAMLAPAPALAVTSCPSGQSTSWTNPAGGLWGEPTNWSNGVPGTGCDASITLAGTYTVVGDVGGAASSLTLGGLSGKQTLQIAGSTSGGGQPQESLFNIGAGNLTVGTNGVLQFTGIGSNPGPATLSGAATIINSGLVRTDVGSGAGTRDIQNNVTNQPGGTIAMHADTITCGCGGTHTWLNHGTVSTDAGTTNSFSGTAAGVLFTQDGGTFTNNGRALVSGEFTHTGGTTTGNAIEVCGGLDAPGPGSAGFTFENIPGTCQGGGFDGDVGAGTSVRVHNTDAGGLIVSSSVNFANHGTLTFDGDAGSGEEFLTGGHVLTNASDGTIQLSKPGATQFQSALTNNGTVTAAGGVSFDTTGTLTQAGGSFTLAAGSTFGSSAIVNLTGGTVANSGQWRQGGELHHTGGTTTGDALEVCGGNLYPSGPGTASFRLVGNGCGSSGVGSDVGSGDTVTFHTAAATADYFNSTFTNHGTLASDGAGTTQLHNGTLSNDGTLDFAGAQTNVEHLIASSGTFNVPAGSGAGLQGVSFTGGQVNVGGTMGVGGPATQSGGTTTVDGTLSLDSSLALSGGTLRGGGTVVAPGGVTNSGGTVHPGHSPGKLSITGDYTQTTGGTLAVDVAGASAGSGYSQLAVSGAAHVAGPLQVNTTVPQSGDLRILTAGSLTGTFSPVGFTGQTDSVGYDATGVTLSATAPPAGSAAPSISGTPKVGSTLSATTGDWSGSPTSFAYQWRRCDAAGAGCADIAGATASSYALVAADVGHTIRVVVTATNAGGSGSATSAQTAPVTAAGGGGGGADKTAPVVLSLSAAPSKFTAGAGAKHGTTFKYKLSEAATVRFTLARRGTGRRSGGKCVKQARKNRGTKRCTRYSAAGGFTVGSVAGANSHRFSGKIGSKKLVAGTYRVTLVATDAAGNRSAARSTTVKVAS